MKDVIFVILYRGQTMKKVITAFLAFILALEGLTACGVSSGSDVVTEAVETIAAETTETTETSLSYISPVVKDFDGYQYIFLNVTGEINSYGIYMVPEEENGEVVNDSLIRRNRTVESAYNIGISENLVANVASTEKKSVLAGDYICDAAFDSASNIYTLALNQCVLDLAEAGNFSFEEPWWDERITGGYAINDKVFIANGDIATGDDKRTFVIMFNKALYNELGFGDPYEIVSGGGWTMDAMGSMIKDVSADLNGDGVMDENDRYGYLSEYLALYYFYIASGRRVIERDDSGKYVYTIGDAEASEIIEKAFNLITSDDTLWNYANIKFDSNYSNVYAKIFAMFGGKQILFNGRVIGDVYAYQMRDIESDYGFLPIPKYREENEYASFIQPDAPMLCMPVTVEDSARSGLLTDAIACESMLGVSDAYYDSLLNEKAARSEEDKLMLKLVLDNKAVDIDAGAGTISGITSMFQSMLSNGSFTLASSWNAIKDSAEVKLAKFVAEFE